MGLQFDIHRTTDSGGRHATLALSHGDVQTPVFMPVGTAATVKTVQQSTLEHIGSDGAGAEIILANTYHLYLRPGHQLIRRMGGVHRFMSWPRPMLTDSGGFQVFSLAKLRKVTPDGVEFRSHLDGSKHFFSPEHSIEVQIALGADIIMTFDECVETPATWERTRESMSLTHAWAARSRDYFEAHKHEVPWAQHSASEPSSNACHSERSEEPPYFAPPQNPSPHAPMGAPCLASETWAGPPRDFTGRTQSLFGIVQGGMYPDLRRESAERLVEMDFPGYAIGGLAVGEPREVTREMIARTLEVLPRDKPRYVMGVGYPDEIEEYARMGVDMMDCVLPTRAARHGLLFRTPEPGEESTTSLGTENPCPIHAGTIGMSGSTDDLPAATPSRTAVRMNIKRLEYADDQRPIDPTCTCEVCRRYTRAYLRHLFVAKEPLGATLNSIHNLSFYLNTMHRVRNELKLST
jgi:queuine tRNA-ribosyltransferase